MLQLFLIIACSVLVLPVAIYTLEVVAGCWPGRKRETQPNARSRPRVAVIVPAHNEACGVAGTIRSLAPQLEPGDRFIVVADNCTDETVAVARQLKATVVERHDERRRGKGFALAFGLDQLHADPPEVVLFFDADCRMTPGTIEHLARTAHTTGRPVQSLNLCEPTGDGSPQQRISGLAFRFKNLIRMRGIARLGGPCHLTGTGMGLPWPLVDQVAWATGNVVEDMQLGIDLLLAGHPPQFVPEACVLSDLPQSDSGVLSQRRRWEHGFLQTALSQVPQLMGTAFQIQSWPLFVLALDLCVPPLALLSLALVSAWLGTLGLWGLGCGAAPFVIISLAGLAFTAATLLGWYVHCRDLAPLGLLAKIPRYISSKLPLYFDFLRRRQQQWVRAERS